MKNLLNAMLGLRSRARRRTVYSPATAEIQHLEAKQLLAGNIPNLLDSKVIAFDVTVDGHLSFNLNTGAYSANIQLPAGMKLDTSALKALLAGQLALPKVDPIQAVAAFNGLKTSVTTDYDKVEADLIKKNGGGNVYFSTLRFTDWASAENIASTTGTAILTGGSTSGQIIQEAKDVILGELGNIYTWLLNKAPQEAETAIAAALKGMLTGEKVDNKYFSLKFVDVKQTYTVGLGGAAATVAQGLGTGSPSKSVTSVHKGFAIVWKGGDSQKSLNTSLANFTGASMSGKALLGNLISRLLNRPELKGLGKVADAVLNSNPSALADQFVNAKLAAVLNLTPDQLKQLYQKGNSIVDLRTTPLGSQLSSLFANIKIGNEGGASVTKLAFNLNTYEITAQVTVRARHSWGSVSDILNAVGKQVGEWTDKAGNTVKTQVDSAKNTVRQIAYAAGEAVKEVWDKAGLQISKSVKSLGKSIESTFVNGVETARNTFVNGVNTLRQEFLAGGKMLETTFANGAAVLQNTFVNGVNTLRSEWQAGGKLIQTEFANGAAVLQNTFVNGVNTFRQAWESGGKYIETTFANGAAVLQNTFVNGANTFRKAWEDGGRYIETTFANGAATLKNTFVNGANTFRQAWESGGKYIETTFENGYATLKNTFVNGANTFRQVWESGAKYIETTFANGYATLKNTFINGANTFRQVWESSSKYIETTFVNGLSTLKNTFINGANTFRQAWEAGGKYIETTFENGYATLKNTFVNGRQVLYQAWTSAGAYIEKAWDTAGNYLSGGWNQLKKLLNW